MGNKEYILESRNSMCKDPEAHNIYVVEVLFFCR